MLMGNEMKYEIDLIIYLVPRNEKIEHQPDVFKGTRLNTCSEGSVRGLRLKNSKDKYYFICNTTDWFNPEVSFEAELRYGPFLGVPCKFRNVREFVYFVNRLTRKPFWSI